MTLPPTILSWGLIAEKEPGCPMWGELPSMAEYPDDQGSSEKKRRHVRCREGARGGLESKSLGLTRT